MELQPPKDYAPGFTLIELLLVLATIGILAIFIPKLVRAVHQARIENAAMSCDTIKTATVDHYGKWGGLDLDGSSGTAVPMVIPNLAYDQMLLKDQFLDKLFAPKIGDGIHGPTNTHIEIRPILTPPVTVLADATSGYNLGGGAGGKADLIGTNVVQAVITGVSEADARALSLWIEGPRLSSPLGQDNLKGRVKYAARSPTTVYIYLTHK
jgi:prepilin-type N-terminal cleavage/methylation domain-containing protein